MSAQDLVHRIGEQGPMTASQTLNESAHQIARLVACGMEPGKAELDRYLSADSGAYASLRAYLTRRDNLAQVSASGSSEQPPWSNEAPTPDR